ncbi:aminoglycoside phosphotransferase family protein [Streptomyces ipomoeae]|uniref:Aminoglycoside phosphotransferase family protein n=1 Tax=Streptomyces ipomoeae TaxID=103232 RepID=A0AAE8VTF5_9ACTN|nr:aminoglycoside phosphotransferase family protein [Streptomyces ipomoeae]TQE15338.1 aminoglycoside phosphotransferase family protein [Streptomyces ipomoeae]
MLPSVDTNDELQEVVGDEALLRPAAQDLCGQLGLAGARIVRFPEGSLPVYAVGDALVLKLYPGFEAAEAVREARLLSHLWGQLPIPTPRLHAADQYKNGWRFVLMSRLSGEDLNEAWPRIPRPHQERIVAEAAECLAALHDLDPKPMAPFVGPPDWTTFMAAQRKAAVEQQISGGLSGPWLEQIPDFLRSVPLSTTRRPVLLHTELMREHLTVDPQDWQLTGLFDFEPAMVGDPAYDFVSVALFLTRADPTLLKLFYEAYGQPPFDPRELMAYTLLHVYSDLNWYLRTLPSPPRQTLESLAETWFSAGG